MRLAVLPLAVCATGWTVPAGAAGDTAGVGLAIIDTPLVSQAFVDGPVTALARGVGNVLFVGSHRLAVFDGVEWRRIEVPGATRVFALAASAEGRRIWLGAGGAFGYIENHPTGEWKFVSLKAQLAAAGLVDADEVRFVFPTGTGGIFVGQARVFRWDGDRISVWNLPTPARLYAFAVGEQPFIYQPGTGLLRMEAAGPELWLPEASMPATPPMISLVRLRNGTEIAVFNEGVFRRAGERWLRLDAVSDQLRGKRATRAVYLPDDTLAIGTSHGGLILADGSGAVRSVINSQRGLVDDTISGLLLDATGQLWVGLSKGFARVAGAPHASFFDQRTRLATRDVRKVLSYDGRPSVVTVQGIYTLATAAASEPAFFSRLEAYWALLRDGVVLDGDLWLADSSGLWRVSPGRGVPEQRLTSEVFLLVAPRAIPHGLLFFENNACKAWLPDAGPANPVNLRQPLESPPVSVIEDHQGDVWLSTANGHVRKFSWAAGTGSLHLIADLTPGRGLPDGVTRPVLTTLGGSIVAFTESVVLAWDPAAGAFSPALGLGDWIGLAAAPAGASGYWIVQTKKLRDTALRALIRVTGPAANGGAFAAAPILAPGLDQVGDVSSVSVTVDGGVEALWIGGSNGVLRLETSSLRPADSPPSLTLQRVATDTEGLVALAPEAPRAFEAGIGRIGISFAPGAAAAADGRFLYETRLEGVEREWSSPQAAGTREFTGLAPGRYRFAARAIDRFGRSGGTVGYAFSIAAPWYRRAPALGLAALCTVLFGGIMLRWRLRQLRRQNEKLNQLVNERTRELSLSNTAKSEFLENISHEIRNPLNGVVGLVALLEKSGLSDPQRAHAKALQECSENLTRVFNDVLNFSKLEYGYVRVEARAFSLVRLLESVRALSLVAAGPSGNVIAVRFPDDFSDGFWGDDLKLQTIVGNFVGNALKYAPGSPVTITVSSAGEADGAVDLLIEVSDRGPGVPVEEQELIFKKFVRGSSAKSSPVPGSGIGLASCRMLARLLGGSVGVESRPGHGAMFFLKLALPRRALVPEVAALPPENFPAEKWALIVDDQPYNQVVLAAVAAELGYRTECAAHAAAVRRAVGARNYDVVFLDIELPETKGPEIARWLRRQAAATRPVIIGATASDTREAEERCLAAGMDAFLVKPLTLEAVRAALGRAAVGRAQVAAKSPEIDLSALELYGRNVPGGTGGAIQTYLALLADEMKSLRAAVDGRSATAVWPVAHRVRSHAALIGATNLSAAAADLEQAARRGDLSESEALLKQVTRAAEAVEGRLTEKTPT